MARPEAEHDSPLAETDDMNFSWDETFKVRPASANTGSTPSHPQSDRVHEGQEPADSGSWVSARKAVDPVPIEDLPERVEARPREAMITLPDDDPLRHDVGYIKDRDITRDSMPTIPDINPLRHDVPELSEPELNAKSSGAGGGGRA